LGHRPAQARLALVVGVAGPAVAQGPLRRLDDVRGRRRVGLPAHQGDQVAALRLEPAGLPQDRVDGGGPQSPDPRPDPPARPPRPGWREPALPDPPPLERPYKSPKATKQIRAPTNAIDRPQARTWLKSRPRSSAADAPATHRAPMVDSGETSTRWPPTRIDRAI